MQEQPTTPAPYSLFQQKVALFFALSCMAAGHVYILVSMPILGRDFGLTDIQTGLIMGISAFILTLSGPLWGIHSDRKGRRPVLTIGLIAAATFPLLLISLIEARSHALFTPQQVFLILLCARTAQVATSGGIIPSAQAWLADHTEPMDRARGMALMGVAYGFGSICGAGLTWTLSGSNTSTALAILSASQIIGAVYIGLRLPTPRAMTEANQSKLHIDISSFFSSGWHVLLPFLIITALSTIAYSALTQVLPLRLADEFHFLPEDATRQSGKIMMLTMIGMIGSQGLVVKILNMRPLHLLQIGSLMAACGITGAAYAETVPVLTLSIVMLGMAFGIMGPGNMALLSLFSAETAQAKTAGTNIISKGIGMAAGPIIGASLHQISPQLPFAFGAAFMMLVIVIAMFGANRSPSTLAANSHSDR